MINLNGVMILTIDDLEAAIINFDENTKTCLRNDFNDVPNSTVLTQEQKDKIKYLKRASVRDQIIAEMATENMTRVRAGVWSVNDLIGLTQDNMLKEILGDMQSLSYELAYGKIDLITNSLITTDIKNAWKMKLYLNFYNS